MSEEPDERRNDGFAAREKLGWMVAGALFVLTLVEYFVAIQFEQPLLWLLPFIIAKGVLIIEYFMHFTALFKPGEH
ncbi:MAG: cytochrome C oxidase subunit IV family protein [Actinomycetia bacterium]|nr:cytochrome C oxidase subunit IV family protein [Actinomycetes bacterium]MCP4087085.1 cytochrome C oxidase subunit IV family protein [Actinomycetes bacterium]